MSGMLIRAMNLRLNEDFYCDPIWYPLFNGNLKEASEALAKDFKDGWMILESLSMTYEWTNCISPIIERLKIEQSKIDIIKQKMLDAIFVYGSSDQEINNDNTTDIINNVITSIL